MKGQITVGFGSLLLCLAILLGPVFFVKLLSDDLWKERSIAAKTLFRLDQNAITNGIWQRIARSREILKCAPNTTCSPPSLLPILRQPSFDGAGSGSAASCPFYFNWIRQDLKPWAKTGITLDMVEAAKKWVNFRLTIVNGRMYIEMYRKSFHTRDMFTFWGIAQLMKFYPGMLPDLDLMLNCGDLPVIGRAGYKDPAKAPPAIFHYCGSENTFDIPFPDWSFWGSLDPALPGSIMHREGSNILRCKPCFNNCTPKKGLHLEIFDPSRRMIEPGKTGSKLVYNHSGRLGKNVDCHA